MVLMPPNTEVSQFPVEAAWTLMATLSIDWLQLKVTAVTFVFSVYITEKEKKE